MALQMNALHLSRQPLVIIQDEFIEIDGSLDFVEQALEEIRADVE